MRSTALIILSLLVIFVAGNAAAQEDIEDSITIDDVTRTFIIHLPPGYDPEQPAPLVLNLHGAGIAGIQMMIGSRFNELGDAAGYILVYPNGIGQRWNHEALPANIEEGIGDDLGFLTALLDYMEANYTIDTNRIFLTGYSNGGLMAFRLGCTLSERFQGVVVIGANLSYQLAENCATAEPTSFFIIIGTRDEAFPWAGYAIAAEGYLLTSLSMQQTMQFLASVNQCEELMPVDVISTSDSPVEVLRDIRVGCANRTMVMLYALRDAGHDWPFAPVVTLPGDRAGDIKDSIWAFFDFSAPQAE